MKCIMVSGCLLGLLLMSGCTPVAPYEKERLAAPGMQADGGNSEKVKLREHIFYSKEASKGGGMISAGGCGCN